MLKENVTLKDYELEVLNLKSKYLQNKELYNMEYSFYEEEVGTIKTFIIYGQWHAEQVMFMKEDNKIITYLFPMTTIKQIAERIKK